MNALRYSSIIIAEFMPYSAAIVGPVCYTGFELFHISSRNCLKWLAT